MATISLNGTTFTPMAVSEQQTKKGTEQESLNGTQRFVHRATKREWTISWKTVSSTVRASVAAVYALTTSFTFIDQFGTSYTVLCKPSGFRSQSSAISTLPSPTNPTIYYDLDLTVAEV